MHNDIEKKRKDLIQFGYLNFPSFDLLVHEASNTVLNSWNHLEYDPYLNLVDKGNNASYRKRRYCRYILVPEKKQLIPLPNKEYIQSSVYNKVTGEIPRLFAPVEKAVAESNYLKKIIFYFFDVLPLTLLDKKLSFYVSIQQIRILCGSDYMGKPSPEGIHQDGEEYFGVLLINRYNISGGKSIIYDLNENILNEFELVKPGDSYIVSDKLVKHSVTPIEVIDASDIGFRDVLIINYRVYTDDLL